MNQVYIFLIVITVTALTVAFLVYNDIPKARADGNR